MTNTDNVHTIKRVKIKYSKHLQNNWARKEHASGPPAHNCYRYNMDFLAVLLERFYLQKHTITISIKSFKQNC
jgi:hypothetical protein